jgi:hypothetical protein
MEISGWPLPHQHCFICRPSDSTVLEDAGIEPSAGIFKQSMEARNRVGIVLSYRPGGIGALESILGLLKRLKIRALNCYDFGIDSQTL